MLDFYVNFPMFQIVMYMELNLVQLLVEKKNYIDNLEHIYFYQISFIQDIEIYLKISGSYIIKCNILK